MKLTGNILASLQSLGRALMLPIAVLPIAGLLLRLGQPDLLDIAFIAAAGNAIFANLGLLFAIGVGVGLAKENNGAAGLAGAVAFLVLTEGAKILINVPADVAKPNELPDVAKALIEAWKNKEISKLSVPAGIMSGVAAGIIYNRFHAIKLPEYLAFFGGRRFVPIATGFAGVIGAMVFGYGFEYLEAFIDMLSQWAVAAGPLGLFAYGVLNRLLIVTGLHHVLNNIAWFIVGDFGNATGDLKRFFAGDPNAGAFMTGYFPIMMFGLPAACLAMYRAAPIEKRRGLAGMFVSLGLTSFLTGVTEPIEFTFMFLAPALYAIHAVLTGLSMAICDIIGMKLGFGFSAGLFDYVLNFNLATKPLLLIPIGLIYAIIYYFSFSFFIRRFNLITPGREIDEEAIAVGEAPKSDSALAQSYIAALGGAQNIETVDACTTRLRLKVVDNADINDNALKAIGAIAVMRLDKNSVQVIIGPKADTIAGDIRHNLPNSALAQEAPRTDKSIDAPLELDKALVVAFGGMENIASVIKRTGRVVILPINKSHIDESLVEKFAPQKWAVSNNGAYHIVLDNL